ncbi:hypothetical protein Hanom_Chr08g00708841 [Helianthus anomalus]
MSGTAKMKVATRLLVLRTEGCSTTSVMFLNMRNSYGAGRWPCEAFSKLHGQDLVQASTLLWTG